MKDAILIHGWSDKKEFYSPQYPTLSNSHWLPWLSKQLMVKDIHTVALEMPRPFTPMYSEWKKELERYDITSETVLVGHSCGAGFLVRWLGEQAGDFRVGGVMLVAPWMGFDPDPDFDKAFFDFEVNPKIIKMSDKFKILHSLDDAPEIQKSVDLLKQKLPDIGYREFSEKGHFTFNDLGSEEFPELLEEILS